MIEGKKKTFLQRADIWFLLAVLGGALALLFVFRQGRAPGMSARISCDGVTVMTIPFSQEETAYYLLTGQEPSSVMIREFSEAEWREATEGKPFDAIWQEMTEGKPFDAIWQEMAEEKPFDALWQEMAEGKSVDALWQEDTEGETFDAEWQEDAEVESFDAFWQGTDLTECFYNIILYKDGEVQMAESNCPDLLCVQHAPIRNTGESIICLPHKIVIDITGEENRNKNEGNMNRNETDSDRVANQNQTEAEQQNPAEKNSQELDGVVY